MSRHKVTGPTLDYTGTIAASSMLDGDLGIVVSNSDWVGHRVLMIVGDDDEELILVDLDDASRWNCDWADLSDVRVRLLKRHESITLTRLSA